MGAELAVLVWETRAQNRTVQCQDSARVWNQSKEQEVRKYRLKFGPHLHQTKALEVASYRRTLDNIKKSPCNKKLFSKVSL